MMRELSKWRNALAERIRQLMVVKADAEDLRKTADEIIKDIDEEIFKADEALDKDGRDRIER